MTDHFGERCEGVLFYHYVKDLSVGKTFATGVPETLVLMVRFDLLPYPLRSGFCPQFTFTFIPSYSGYQ